MQTAHRFGREGHLAGVITLPDGEPMRDVGVVIPNAGYIHHVGPWQLHVDLARRLAAAGVPSVRFDLSGLGDSESPRRGDSPAARTRADIADAIDLLTDECRVRRVVVAGLCSGAVDSHRAALAEDRICGAALLDPPAYPNLLYHVIYWSERLLNPARVLRFVRRRFRQAAARGQSGASGVVAEPYRPMSAQEFAAEIETATQRGVEYLFCYSGVQEYRYRRQLYTILTPATPLERIAVYHFPRLEHTPILIEDRRIIADTLLNWMHQKFF